MRGEEYMNEWEEEIALFTGGNRGMAMVTAKAFVN